MKHKNIQYTTFIVLRDGLLIVQTTLGMNGEGITILLLANCIDFGGDGLRRENHLANSRWVNAHFFSLNQITQQGNARGKTFTWIQRHVISDRGIVNLLNFFQNILISSLFEDAYNL